QCHNSTLHYFILFFFSSRRRHTRFSRDWSSDVCSSDLHEAEDVERHEGNPEAYEPAPEGVLAQAFVEAETNGLGEPVGEAGQYRSEERRVGKERRRRRERDHHRKTTSEYKQEAYHVT